MIHLNIKKNQKAIKIAKIVIASILGLMILADIILVKLGMSNDEVPTFSKVIKQNRTSLIWLNFLLGGLVSKIFYNRIVYVKRTEISGVFAFMTVILVLWVLGQFLPNKLDNMVHFAVMLGGGIMARFAWPQFVVSESTK
ncbi:hypothetical protein GTQ34_02105 [Muricauda sp. JGD-17]|uniref:Uncharacterized protein n=1 Tax=Flagellimonas ochracea TaxID=2696472 RepID=A0A964WW81_9FLAO|nr:hypothetical protein [Allomuricauda ochracea]NAY90700.1 hypothetical protein [Allomuricauda ochracea]